MKAKLKWIRSCKISKSSQLKTRATETLLELKGETLWLIMVIKPAMPPIVLMIKTSSLLPLIHLSNQIKMFEFRIDMKMKNFLKYKSNFISINFHL